MEELPNKKTSLEHFQIRHPGSFSFRAEEWDEWLPRFERFRRISGLENNMEDVQIDYLLYEMGGKSEQIMNTFQLEENKR